MNLGDALRPVSSAMTSKAHGLTLCSELLFHRENRSHLAMQGWVEGVSRYSRGGIERVMEVFKVEDQALLFNRGLRVYSRGLRQKNLFRASVLKTEIQL